MALSEADQQGIKVLSARIAKANKERQDACTAAIEAALKQYNCRLNPIYIFDVDGLHTPTIQIQALQDKPE